MEYRTIETWEEEPLRHRPPRRRRKRRRITLLPILFALLIGIGLGWLLRGHFSAEAKPALKAPPASPKWIVQSLLPKNRYSRPGTQLDEVAGIVIHYVGNPGTTAEQNNSYFRSLAETRETYASSHFLIGMDGEILQNIPLDEVAYCSNDRNHDTLSIECCHPDETGAFTQETYDALIKLVRWLMDYYELAPEQVIRHYDVTGKECPRYYVQNPEAWEEFRNQLTHIEE